MEISPTRVRRGDGGYPPRDNVRFRSLRGRRRVSTTVTGRNCYKQEKILSAARTDSLVRLEDDIALAAAVLRKDRKATATLVELYSDAVYGYIHSRLAPHFDKADDLTQEVFLAAWRSLPDYRGDSSLRAWLLGIARHKIEDYYRALLRAPEPLQEEEANEPAAEPESELEDILDQERLREKVQRVMQSMPEHYAMLLLWRYWEKRSAREVGEQTGRSEKAVERMLARARDCFRERWTDA